MGIACPRTDGECFFDHEINEVNEKIIGDFYKLLRRSYMAIETIWFFWSFNLVEGAYKSNL